MLCLRRVEKINWSEKVTNKELSGYIWEKRALINKVLRRKANWIGYNIRINYLLQDAIEGQITEMKPVR